MVLDIDLCVLTGIVPNLLGDSLCRRLSSMLTPALPAREPVQIELSRSRMAGAVGAGTLVFDKCLPNLLG